MKPVPRNKFLKNLELSNIYSFLSVVNIYKKNPAIIDILVLEKTHFFKLIASDTVLDCFIIESVFYKSNLSFDFKENVKILRLNLDSTPNLYKKQKNLFLKFKRICQNKIFQNNSFKIFDSSITINELIKDGLIKGNNYISIDGKLHKSDLLNNIVKEGQNIN